MKASIDLKQSECYKLQQSKRALEHELRASKDSEVFSEKRIKEL